MFWANNRTWYIRYKNSWFIVVGEVLSDSVFFTVVVYDGLGAI